MTTEQKELTVEQKNAVIAEFMELQPIYEDGQLTNESWILKKLNVSFFKYHLDWNWLMPVVEKIEGLSHKGFPILVNIFGSGAYIGINPTNAGADKYEGKLEIANTLNSNYFNDYPGAEQVKKIVAVHEAVFQFIQWYNQQHEQRNPGSTR